MIPTWSELPELAPELGGPNGRLVTRSQHPVLPPFKHGP